MIFGGKGGMVSVLLEWLKFDSVEHKRMTNLHWDKQKYMWLFELLLERIFCHDVQYKASATACSTGQSDK